MTPALVEETRASVLPVLEAALGPFGEPVPIEVHDEAFFLDQARARLARPEAAGSRDVWKRLLSALGELREEDWNAEALTRQNARDCYDRGARRILLRDDLGIHDPALRPILVRPFLRYVLLHEFVHALRDRRGLCAGLGAEGRGWDETWAARALMEGDAQFFAGALRCAHAESVGESLQQEARRLGREEEDPGPFPFYPPDPSPSVDWDLSCYVEGARFVAAVYRERGAAGVERLFADPPASSEEVLHPERYLQRREGDCVRIEGLDLRGPLGDGWKPVGQGDLGELDLRLILRKALGAERARHVAAGWCGCGFVLYEGPGGTVLALCSRWDDEEEALEFATRWCDFAGRRGEGTAYTARVDLFDTGERRTVEKEGRRIATVRRGVDVAVLEGPADLDPGPLFAAVWNTARLTAGTRARTRPRPAAERRDRPGAR